MNRDIWEGKWQQWKGKLRQQWGKLTDDDLDRIQGSQEEIVGVLQERYGRTKEAAEQEWKRFREASRPQEAGG